MSATPVPPAGSADRRDGGTAERGWRATGPRSHRDVCGTASPRAGSNGSGLQLVPHVTAVLVNVPCYSGHLTRLPSCYPGPPDGGRSRGGRSLELPGQAGVERRDSTGDRVRVGVVVLPVRVRPLGGQEAGHHGGRQVADDRHPGDASPLRECPRGSDQAELRRRLRLAIFKQPNARPWRKLRSGIWPVQERWRRDLNPRRDHSLTRFRGVLLRPLGHATAEKATGRVHDPSRRYRHAGRGGLAGSAA